MEKLIILSIVFVVVAVPGVFATSARPRKALPRAQGIVVAFVIIWAWMCTHWYPTLVELK